MAFIKCVDCGKHFGSKTFGTMVQNKFLCDGCHKSYISFIKEEPKEEVKEEPKENNYIKEGAVVYALYLDGESKEIILDKIARKSKRKRCRFSKPIPCILSLDWKRFW